MLVSRSLCCALVFLGACAGEIFGDAPPAPSDAGEADAADNAMDAPDPPPPDAAAEHDADAHLPDPDPPDAAPAPDPPDASPDDDLEWNLANLTYFTSYPEPGSDECEDFNGCKWAGHFAFVSGQQSEQWVMDHDIAAVHSDYAEDYALETLRLRSGDEEIDVTVYDVCSDADCDGCCTQNSSETGFLIDLESYTAERFGVWNGIIEWTCLDCDE